MAFINQRCIDSPATVQHNHFHFLPFTKGYPPSFINTLFRVAPEHRTICTKFKHRVHKIKHGPSLKNTIYLSIVYPGSGHGSAACAGKPRLHPGFLGRFQGVSRTAKRDSPSSMSWVYAGASIQWDML